MAKIITFNTATKEGPVAKTGFKVRLMVGNTVHMFVLQHDFERPSILTDYRTGYKLASLAGLMLARYVGNPYATDYSSRGFRKLAQEWLNNVVDEKGEEHVLAMLAKPATLNK